MIALLAWLAKHSGVAKLMGGGLIVAAGAWGVMTWRASVYEAGFAAANAQAAARVEEANKRAAVDQGRLDQMMLTFGAVASRREQAINLQIKPMTERIQDAVASDPRYRDCAVDQRVLDDLQAGRAAVNAAIAAGATGKP